MGMFSVIDGGVIVNGLLIPIFIGILVYLIKLFIQMPSKRREALGKRIDANAQNITSVKEDTIKALAYAEKHEDDITHMAKLHFEDVRQNQEAEKESRKDIEKVRDRQIEIVGDVRELKAGQKTMFKNQDEIKKLLQANLK